MSKRILAAAFVAAILGTPLAGVAPALAQEPAEQPALAYADAVLFESLEQLRAIAERGPTVLYFHADWCPTCQATMISFQARWPEVKPGLTLVIADYDRDVALKTRYGVTFQNTYVQVDRDLNRLLIWNGGGVDALNSRTIFDERTLSSAVSQQAPLTQ